MRSVKLANDGGKAVPYLKAVFTLERCVEQQPIRALTLASSVENVARATIIGFDARRHHGSRVAGDSTSLYCEDANNARRWRRASDATRRAASRPYNRLEANSKHRNRIQLEISSQKQSSDTHKTRYDRVKRCRERKINIKASERVNSTSSLPDKPSGLKAGEIISPIDDINKLVGWVASLPKVFHETTITSYKRYFTVPARRQAGHVDADQTLPTQRFLWRRTDAEIGTRLCDASDVSAVRLHSGGGQLSRWPFDRHRLAIVRDPNTYLTSGAAVVLVVRLLASHPFETGFRMWESGGRFLGDIPFPAPLNSGAAPYSTRFTLIGSQDLDVKSHPNLSNPLFSDFASPLSDSALFVPETWSNKAVFTIEQGDTSRPTNAASNRALFAVAGRRRHVPYTNIVVLIPRRWRRASEPMFVARATLSTTVASVEALIGCNSSRRFASLDCENRFRNTETFRILLFPKNNAWEPRRVIEVSMAQRRNARAGKRGRESPDHDTTAAAVPPEEFVARTYGWCHPCPEQHGLSAWQASKAD
ncbi:hypothetical protein PR048_015843 [Dryococelus australis]|uniref:Uncharacterized protein n=1 Tax=Dryococelus australis TaxID=614101 RepID=A0ABQ9HIA1_9NEOP|nr:hypothetical protein PR048_015843 [Dryococelus australis]